uniref:NF-X1-type domain-containing protein n=1 Tax=Chenopodium quinoa TaxID=63459 RepID=A0A803M3T6_CHEQI
MSSTKNPPQSHSSDYDSDTVPNSSAHQLRHVDLSNTIFKAYLEINGQDSSSSPQSLDLTKIQSFLNSSSSGALSCLICLERIKSTDPTWSCNGFCFAVFHLQCIQNWAQQSTALAASRASPYRLRPRLILRCAEICHNDECPPCREKGVYRCQCGKVKEERECCDRDFRCDNPCGQGLDCGKHVCERGCHGGVCSHCPLKGRRTCPCGRRVYEGIPCDVEVALCGATCDKKLSCGKHTCHERCHRGSCVEICRIMITKSCRCGSVKKQIWHVKGSVRENVIVGATHVGVVAVMEIVHLVQRFVAGGSVVETTNALLHVIETEQKPPRCRKTCRIAPLCRHKSICKPHKCHYGNCPPCGLPCGEEYPCGHACKLRCHGPRPPPNPEFTLKPKKKKHNLQSEPTVGTPCPPCPELVWRSCLGQHFAAERMMVCSNKAQFSCDNLCGNSLACGNHYCTKTCHALQNVSSSSDQRTRGVPCEDCTLPCQKAWEGLDALVLPLANLDQWRKDTACSHPFPQPCHPEECPLCKVLLKRACHCGAMVHVFECIYYNTLSEKEQLSARSCGGPCHRKLPYCTHLCPETCHPGPCPSPEKCCKKVTVRCGCHNLKKEWLCCDVQTSYRNSGHDLKDIPKTQYGYGLLSCDSSCKSKAQAAESELLQRKSKAPEKKVIENEANVPKRRKRRGRVQEMKQDSKFQKFRTWLQRFVMFIIVLVALVAVACYGYKGLLSLNDWMNKVEEHREKRRYRRI